MIEKESVPVRFKEVVIVNPPSPPGYTANRDSMGGYGQLYPAGVNIAPPLDMPYLAGYLAEKGVPIHVLEAQGLELTVDGLIENIRKAIGPDPKSALIVVRTALCSLDWDLSVCKAIKAGASSASVAIWGSVLPHVRNRVRQESSLSYVIHNEPDETVYELSAGTPEDKILGLSWRRADGWAENPERPFLKELDKLPFPKWELMPYKRYAIPRSSNAGPLPFLPMLTSRGCPFGCHYCPYPLGQGLPFRHRSPQNVVDEIEHLVKDLGIEYILFRDPMFSLRQDRVLEICNEIQRRGLVFRWKCETRPDCIDENTLKAMAAAGCNGINFGVESSEMQIQKNVGRKPISGKVIIDRVALCRKLGIKTFCFFIIGLPGDTAQTILDTIGFALSLRANWVQFNAASPMIGTKLRDWAVSSGLTPDNEYSYRSSHEAMMGNENLTKNEVQALHRFAFFLEKYLLNRGGVLKDETRRGLIYGTAKKAADFTADTSARLIFALGRVRFQRAVSTAAQAS
jgi:hypothetical protein